MLPVCVDWCNALMMWHDGKFPVPPCIEKLDVDVGDVKNGVEGLMHFLTECSKSMVSLPVSPGWLVYCW